MHVAYALSVHSFVDKIGAYLGFAALIGVALLVIMFFVQARETALLRDRAEDAEEDLERLRQYAEQVSRQAAAAHQVAAQAGQAAQAGRAPGQAAARPAAAGAVAASRVATAPAVAAARTSRLPVAPVGVGAPALSSATRLIPLAEPAPGPSTPAAGANGQAAAPPSFNARAAAAPSVPAPPPAVAATTSHRATSAPTAAPAPAPAPAPVLRAGGPDSESPGGRAPRRDYGRPESGGSRVGRGSVALAAVLVAVIIVAAVLVITHHSHHAKASRTAATTTSRSSSKSTTKGKGRATSVHVNPTSVRVAVLNGTDTNNLAADVSAKLNKVGFQQGETSNYANQTQTSTTIGYLPGNQAKGLAVAKALGLSVSDVHQVNSQAQQLVCPSGPSQCADQVVVIVGSNLDSDAS